MPRMPPAEVMLVTPLLVPGLDESEAMIVKLPSQLLLRQIATRSLDEELYVLAQFRCAYAS